MSQIFGKKRNNKSFSYELNGENAIKRLFRYKLYFVRYRFVKFKNCQFRKKNDLRPLITGSNIVLGPKNAPSIVSTLREQFAVFFSAKLYDA